MDNLGRSPDLSLPLVGRAGEGVAKLIRMPVTEADFNLQGRVDNYRERLYELLVALDELVRTTMEAVNRDKLQGSGRLTYEPRPPRWTLGWKSKTRRPYEVNLMAFAQGGAWVIHGRMGLDRPFRNLKSVRERDEAAIRREVEDQVSVDETLIS